MEYSRPMIKGVKIKGDLRKLGKGFFLPCETGNLDR